MTEYLILVNEKDEQYGKLEKLLVHKSGLLHRAFSVFIFNTNGELLLQQRADGKYHSAGLWSNTCCSHPRFDEEVPSAVERRLQEEMGLKCHTDFIFSFIYKIKFENGLTEHEYDHIYFGTSDQLPVINKAEVKCYKYVSLDDLFNSIKHAPEAYTEWLKICLPEVAKYFNNSYFEVAENELDYSGE